MANCLSMRIARSLYINKIMASYLLGRINIELVFIPIEAHFLPKHHMDNLAIIRRYIEFIMTCWDTSIVIL